MTRYDLSLDAADYAPWTGVPRASLVICSHPRSGSTMLGEAIAFAGGLGCPLEYLHRGFRPALAQRWRAPDLDSYVSAMHRYRTEPNGTLSIKLFWQDIAEVLLERRPGYDPALLNRPASEMRDEEYRDIAGELASILPNPHYVYLYRRDRLRQAVSSLIATQTGVWRQIDGATKAPSGDAEYDYDRIMALIAFGEFSHGHWRGFFAANGITPRTIAYEDLVADYDRIVGGLLGDLGATNPVPQPRRMRRQSDGTGDALMLRFLQEHAARPA
ncbi:MAG TPA: Stf0 family sulfotransferase [Sphingomonas sp.]|nr:Stf0 family sulfotransferase [Sphingomonas sp.]